MYSCVMQKTYEQLEEDFSFNLLCQYFCGFNQVEAQRLDGSTLHKFEKKYQTSFKNTRNF